MTHRTGVPSEANLQDTLEMQHKMSHRAVWEQEIEA